MRQLLIAFSFIAVISLPDIIARSQKEELETEENYPFDLLSGLAAWLQDKVSHIRPGRTLSPPATLHSLPLDVHKV
jgi:hypothetical protein